MVAITDKVMRAIVQSIRMAAAFDDVSLAGAISPIEGTSPAYRRQLSPRNWVGGSNAYLLASTFSL